MNDGIDIRDITLGDLVKVIGRLKLASIIWILSGLIALLGAVYVAGIASAPMLQGMATQTFTPHFTEGFVSQRILRPLLPEILEELPDGIETHAEAMASLLWQIKSQDGFAEFLKSDKFFNVKISYSDDSFNFEWNRGNSAIPKILNQLGLSVSDEQLAQLNAEMNLTGVAWLPDSNRIVRSLDGGLALVGKQ